MADSTYVDYRRASRGNAFTAASSNEDAESEDLGMRQMNRREPPIGRSMPAVEEQSELPTSSGTEYVDYADEAARRNSRSRRVPVPTSTEEEEEEDAYNGRRPSRSGSRRGRGSPPIDTSPDFLGKMENRAVRGDDDITRGHGGNKAYASNAFEDVMSEGTSEPASRDWRRGEPGAPPSFGPNVLNDHIVPVYDEVKGASRLVLEIKQLISFGLTALGFGITFAASIGMYLFSKVNPGHKTPARAKIDEAWLRRIPGERFSARTEYYAEFWGYDCDAHDVETEDGFVLRMYHIKSRKRGRRMGPPVVIQHGILCNSTHFVVNEERSMAFWLVEQGYDVWIGNIRTNFKMPHRKFERHDPRYWAWAVKEIGLYDCTAQIEYVYEMTGGRKVNYIGHSQGGGTMFIALSQGMRPDIADKMASFTGLAPAVYAGAILQKFPYSILRLFRSRPMWSLILGVREFIPLLSLLANILPAWLFGHLAIPTFFGLFRFHDHNWVPRQVPKLFRSVPVATSSELLYFYMGNFSYTGCFFDERIETPWFPPGFPPFALFYGDCDTLIDGFKLVDRIRKHEPNVPMQVCYELKTYEHLDMVWGANVVEEVFIPLLRFLDNAGEKV